MAVTQAMLDRVKKFEGAVPFMYLDTKGKVTVGVGHLLPSGDAATALDFALVVTGKSATNAQIKAKHTMMLQKEKGQLASYYKKFRTMEIDSDAIDELLTADMSVSEADLKSIFSGWAQFPAAAQEALMDMAFNLGKSKFLKYTALITACKAKDWATASLECSRDGVQPERNAETEALFDSLIKSRAPDLPALLRDAVAGAAQGLRAQPHLFPNGVGHLEVEVSHGPATVRVRATGASAPGAAAMPESCRERRRLFGNSLVEGERVPDKAEASASGAIQKKIRRTDPEFKSLVNNTNPDIVFKDEEGTGADRMMTAKLRDKLAILADKAKSEWLGSRLRVTEAWDEDDEHAGKSLHYEGRAADLTLEPNIPSRLGRLGQLAVDSGFDWVWYENSAHIHVSVKA